jgi:hypothetical protein
MNSIVKSVEYIIYEPQFNPDTNAYVDVCPYKPRERNRFLYTCRCKAGTEINNRPQFASHVKSECHKNYIENYAFFKNELLEEKKLTKKLTYDNEILNRKYDKKEKEYEKLEKIHITMLNSVKKYCNKNKKAYDKFKGQLDEMLQEE